MRAADMATSLQSAEMDWLFQTGATIYQPEGLAQETGDPKIALANVDRLLTQGLIIKDISCRPTGVLIGFQSGERFYTPGLRVGGDGLETEYLAEIAAKAGFGPVERLLDNLHEIPTPCCTMIGPQGVETFDPVDD
jgi:hypothetical protein